MKFTDVVEIDAGSQRVWERASDPEVLLRCVPGAKQVEQVNERKYTGVVERGIANISVALDGEAEITKLDAPETIVATASGEDSRTNSRLDAIVELEITSDGDSSILHYEIDLNFTGRLATLGSRVVKRKIKSDLDTFINNLKQDIESE